MSDELGIINKPPYFDDFDPSKNYAKILFRPGRAVQSRELTQIQSIIQNQIASIGDKILPSPIISGGDFQISSVKYLKFYSETDPSFLLNKIAIVGSGELQTKFKILHIEAISEEAAPNNYSIFFEFRNGKELLLSSLLPTIDTEFSATVIDEDALEQANYQFVIKGTDTSGLDAESLAGLVVYGDALLARLGSGVFYKKGYFIVTDDFLSLPLSTVKYTNGSKSYLNYSPTIQNTRVGLKLSPNYVTTEEDPTLFDPSAGYYNFAAPGADRLKISPSLVQIPENSTEDLIELVDVVDGDSRVVDPGINLQPVQNIFTDSDCGEDRILKPFIIDIIGTTLNINSGRAVVNCTDIEIVENQTVSLVKDSENKRLFNQPFNDQCLADAIIVQSNSENPLLSGVAGNDYTVVNTNYFGSGKIRKLFSDEAVRLEIVNCDGIKIGCLTLLDIQKNDSTSYRLFFNELQSYSETIPVSSLFTEACTLSLDGEKVFTFGSSLPLSCSDTTPGGNRRLVYSVPRGTNLKAVFDADYMITRDFVADIKANATVPYTKNSPTGTTTAVIAEFNMDIPNGVFNDNSTITPNKDMFIFTINGKVVPLKDGNTITPYMRIDSRTKVTVVLSSEAELATDDSGNSINIPTAGKCYMITKVRFPEKSPGTPDDNISGTPIPHRKKILREARGVYLQDLEINQTISLGFSDVYRLKSIKDSNGTDITSDFIFDDGQRNDRYDHATITLMNIKDQYKGGEKEYTVEFRYFEHQPIAPGFYGPITVNSYGFNENGEQIPNFHGKDLNGNQMTLAYDEIPNFLDRVSGEVISLTDAVDFRMVRTEEGLIENGVNRSSILRGRWFPSPDSSAAVEASYRLDLPRIDLLVLREDGSFALLEGESATNPVPPEYPKDGCVIAEINVPGTVVSSEDYILQKPPIKTISLPELNDMQSRLAELEKALSIQTLENKARVQSSVLKNEFLTGMVVDDFGGHYIGDVSNDEYNCSMDFSRGTLRSPFTTKFIDFIPNYSGSYIYPKTETEESSYFATAPTNAIGVTFINNNQGTTELTVNPFSSTEWHGYLSFDRPYQLWIDQTTKPIIRNNNRGQNDAWESGGEAVQTEFINGIETSVSRKKGFGTQWGFWKSLWFGDSLLGNKMFEKDRASAKSFADDITNTAPSRFARSINRDSLLGPTRKTIGNGGFALADGKTNRYVDSSLSFFSPENYIIVRGYGLKPNTTFSVYFENMNVPVSQGRIYDIDGDSLTKLTSENDGKLEFVLYIPNGSYITGNKVIKVVENTNTSKPSFASGVYSNVGSSWKDRSETDENTVDLEFLSIDRGDIVLKNEKTLYNTGTPINGIYQKFFVDKSEHPYGLILDSVGIYFSSIDSTYPVSVEIRKITSGKIDTNRIIRNSRVESIPTQIGYKEFAFNKPVYLSSGEYALCVRTDSSNYKVHVSQRGLARVDSVATALDEEIYASTVFGVSGFYGSTSFSKVEDQATTLRFFLKRKSFITNTQTNKFCRFNKGIFESKTPSSNRFDLMHFANDNWRITVGDVDYRIVTVSGEKSISSNTDIERTDTFDENNTSNGVRVLVSTTREDISPIVDIRKFGMLFVKNHISKTLDCIDKETLSFGGSKGSATKYITRRTDLSLPANVLRVSFESMIPSDLDVRVYAKVLYEGDLDFDNNEYLEMSRISGSPSIYRDKFGEMIFELDLTDKPKNFVSFSTKVIITSNNTENVEFYPEIRNFTAVSSIR